MISEPLSEMGPGDIWENLKLPKVGKGCLKLSFFYGSDIDGIVCVRQIGLGLARAIKKY